MGHPSLYHATVALSCQTEICNLCLVTHLACDGYTEPVSCPYSPFRAASARPPCGGRRRLWDFRTNSRALLPLRFGLARSFTNLKNRKPVAPWHVVGGIAQSPHGHRAKADPRTGSVRFQCGGCGDCTATALTSHNVPVRIYPGLPPRPCRRNCTMPVDNVNTYAVACSHLRCPKNRTENRRKIYRTASGANVN